MMKSRISYLRTDDDKMINEMAITWIKKMNECLEVCVRSNGCEVKVNTHKICKTNSPTSYEKLNKLFK